jgi:NADPH:quinone reductase-like Zn-dependent oxidoreductase
VKSLGADTVIDYTKDNGIESGTRYDIVFDAVGKRKSSILKLQCKKNLTPNGKYISVDDGSPTPTMENLILLKNLAEANQIKPVIDRCYPLEKMVEAHQYVDTGHKKGNVVISIGHDSIR